MLCPPVAWQGHVPVLGSWEMKEDVRLGGGMWVIAAGVVHCLAKSGFQALGRCIGM